MHSEFCIITYIKLQTFACAISCKYQIVFYKDVCVRVCVRCITIAISYMNLIMMIS